MAAPTPRSVATGWDARKAATLLYGRITASVHRRAKRSLAQEIAVPDDADRSEKWMTGRSSSRVIILGRPVAQV